MRDVASIKEIKGSMELVSAVLLRELAELQQILFNSITCSMKHR
jgi:hypothetical protein